MKTTIHEHPRVSTINSQPVLHEIELNETDLPYFEHSSEGTHVATVTLRVKGRAARFFLRVALVDGVPSAEIIGLRQTRNNPSRVIIGEWNEKLEQNIAAFEKVEGVSA